MLRLDGGEETLLVAQRPGPPVLAYWGPRLPAEIDPAHVEALVQRAIPGGGLDSGEAFDLLPEAARGFTGHPALEVHRAGGGFRPNWRSSMPDRSWRDMRLGSGTGSRGSTSH